MADYKELIEELRYRASWCYGGEEEEKRLFIESADAIEELTKSPWISVKDRLPESGTHALVMRFDYVTKTPFYDLLWFDEGKWWNRHFTGNYAVTHWMPLPVPPKGEEE